MNFYKDKIIFTGGSGRFGKVFKSAYSFKNIYYPSKKDLDICNYKSIKKILKKIKPKILNIINKRGIKRAGIFGSYARGEQKKNSDIDILIEPTKKIGFFERIIKKFAKLILFFFKRVVFILFFGAFRSRCLFALF
jgi:predicted nucleotidyltransferase